MEHIICRCKNCQRQYTYCTYGNGPEYGTERGCTTEYCAECANAIAEALNKIPRKYTGIRQKITDPNELERINTIFDRCKEKYNKEVKFKMARLICDLGYEHVEGCYINKVEFHRCTTADGIIHIYAEKEFDLVKDEYTGKYFFRNDNPNEKYFLIHQLKFDFFKKDLVSKPMSEPSGKLYYVDYPEWDIIKKKNNDSTENNG